MKMTLSKTNKTVFLVAFALLMFSDAAFAQTWGKSAEGVFGQMKSFADVATAGAFLAGIVIGIVSLFKFKAYGDNPQQNKIGAPIILALVAAGLIGLPAFLNTTKETIVLGAGGSMDAGNYKTIGK